MTAAKAAHRPTSRRRAVGVLASIGLLLTAAVLPGIFLGCVIPAHLEALSALSGPVGAPCGAVIILAVEIIAGAALVGFWREKLELRGLLFLPVLLLFAYSLSGGALFSLAVAALLAGGYLAALPYALHGALRPPQKGSGPGFTPDSGSGIAAPAAHAIATRNAAAAAFPAGAFATRIPGFVYRLLFGITFAITVLWVTLDPFAGVELSCILLPVLMAAAVLWIKARWWVRLLLIGLIPVAAVLYTGAVLQPRPVPAAAVADYFSFAQEEIAPALPAAILPGATETRILFLSARFSPLPQVWSSLPFVTRIDAVWPAGRMVDEMEKLNLTRNASPGRALRECAGPYELIYLDTVPAVPEATLRRLLGELAARLAPDGGILIVPAERTHLLPAGLQAAYLPGSAKRQVAAGPPGFPVAPAQLDDRLQELQEFYGEHAVFMPPGIFTALYGLEPGADVAPGPAADATPGLGPKPDPGPTSGLKPIPGLGPTSGSNPEAAENWFLPGLVLMLIGYMMIRLFFGRSGRGFHGFALFENHAAFTLVLLAAWNAVHGMELFTGVPTGMVWALPGLAAVSLPLRRRAAGVLALVAAGAAALLVLPGFLPGMTDSVQLAAIAVAGVIFALSTGVTRGMIAVEAGFPRTWSIAFCALGVAVSAAVYAAVASLLPQAQVLLPVVITAIVLRLLWPLKV